MLPGQRGVVRGRGHGDQQRAPGAAGAQGARAARRGARRHRDHLSTSPAGSATTGRTTSSEAVWDELRSLSPMHAGMSLRAGSRSSAASSGRAPSEDRLEPSYLHGRLWADDPADRGRPRRSRVVDRRAAGRRARRRVPAAAHDRPPARLVQHRRAVGRLRLPAALRRDHRPVARRTPSASAIEPGEKVRVIVPARHGDRPGPDRPGAAARPGLHDDALPRRGRHQHADHRGHRSQVGARPSSRPRPSGSRSSSRSPRPAADAGWTCTSSTPADGRGARRGRRRARPARVGLERRGAVGAGRPRRLRRREAAQALRPQLLPALHAVNDRVGWISQGALNYVAAAARRSRRPRPTACSRSTRCSRPSPARHGWCTSAPTSPAGCVTSMG